jgi:hypothetical protein
VEAAAAGCGGRVAPLRSGRRARRRWGVFESARESSLVRLCLLAWEMGGCGGHQCQCLSGADGRVLLVMVGSSLVC